MSDNYFVVSSYGNSSVEWLKSKSQKEYCVYLKDKTCHDSIEDKNIIRVDNVGYNIYSYMRYIVDNYENIPDVVVFCKNNVFPRHVSKEVFIKLSERRVFTPIEEPSRWDLKYPMTLLGSDNGFLELNNSWYTPHNPSKYFTEFDDFWKFIFDTNETPRYLRFAPGANYVVPKENIKLRTKEFYINIMNFVSHHQFSGESHMVERALYTIWNSTIAESREMSVVLNDIELNAIIKNKILPMRKLNRLKNHWQIKVFGLLESIFKINIR
jgi:hypothetical protein